jgi:hypothetical protein
MKRILLPLFFVTLALASGAPAVSPTPTPTPSVSPTPTPDPQIAVLQNEVRRLSALLQDIKNQRDTVVQQLLDTQLQLLSAQRQVPPPAAPTPTPTPSPAK